LEWKGTLPFPVQGTSALAASSERPTKKMYAGGKEWEFPAAPPASWPALERKRELFGDPQSWDEIERFGSRPSLIGRPAPEPTRTEGDRAARGEIERLDRFAAVDPGSGELPAYVRGIIRCDGEVPPTDVALALNGTIWAVGSTFAREQGSARFSLLLPESAFRSGDNEVRLYAVTEGDHLSPIELSRS